MNLKQHLYNQCQNKLNERLEVIKHKIVDIENALQSETKSSAGDKHETGRAMLQLEREKAGQQLAELQKQTELLHKIDNSQSHTKVALGSVVKTTGANYFISISVGDIHVNNESYFAISAATPIGQLLLSKQAGNTIAFREQRFTITTIL